ncbi:MULTISPECIES: excisionase family DNA-binding protein [Mycobacterium]|uniref:Excisionase family protein DNA binding protein n=1 Tax=Mycobacterium avium (strain 104) TaxID=243243 RepID=A0A0H2ZYY4_MYCA1|nr:MULTISPECIES: excisionase family DNA-binding protein [Mycobacterium]ABK66949.1 excisionase family protein DNA binding protein [Mycobacterium avium 104]ETZ57999.1 DNA binding, excisionase family domain protein [Mycobacterium sp. MAC_080597_8934]ETZ76528.1 DNA binding, excisionase family domain protein [Mycobacterium sp. MAC_011194_8550]KDP08335.1 excisionase [Mycobacterium avium subsp. hominissuis 101]MCG3242488.1 excisionase family DNA-binding protein [Mycobacterium avium subsp. hominissuis
MADRHIHAEEPTNQALTVAQVADQLSTSVRSVQRWIKEGRVRAVRLPGGRGYRIYQRDLDEALTVIETQALTKQAIREIVREEIEASA